MYLDAGTRIALAIGALFACLITPLTAQVEGPAPYVDYQGTVFDDQGNPLAETTPTNYNMEFRIWDSAENGAVIWAEKQVVTVNNGMFSVRLGSGVAIPGLTTSESSIANAFKGQNRFLGLTVFHPPSATTAAEITPRLAFQASPFAFVAETARTVPAGAITRTAIANDAIDGTKIADRSIGTLHIADGHVQNADIQNGAVTGAKIAGNTITGSNIVDGTITAAKLAPGAGSLWAPATGGIRYNGGRVGIGTTAPDRPLTIVGEGVTNEWISLKNNAGATKWHLTNHAGGLNFTETGVASARLFLKQGGKVGIGTESPDKPLTIVGEGSTNEWISLKNSAGTTKWSINNRNGGLNFAETGIADARLYLKAGGKVGIGTEFPASQLHIKGSGKQTLSIESTGTLWEIYCQHGVHHGDGATYGDLRFSPHSNTSYFGIAAHNLGDYRSSDVRLKKNITPLESVLDRTMRLRPVRYHLKSQDDSDAQTIGFIAQEVDRIFPELVYRSDEEEHLALFYSGFGPVAIGAIRELKLRMDAELEARDERIALLEQELQALKQRDRDQETRLTRLETMLSAAVSSSSLVDSAAR